jgi:hypothetical protein
VVLPSKLACHDTYLVLVTILTNVIKRLRGQFSCLTTLIR